MSGRGVTDCRRTPGLIDRVVDGRLTDEDRRHAPSCASCGPVLARAASFDDELRRSARALVVEELPRGILDQPLDRRSPGVVSRRASPGLAAILAAVAILLTATVIALAPGTGPLPSPSPSVEPGPPTAPASTPATTPPVPRFIERFRSTEVIRGQLLKLGYGCNDGAPVPSPGSAPDAVAKESTICLAPESIGPFMAAVIVGESANGKVTQLTIKAEIVGDDTTESRAAVAAAVAKIFALSLVDEGAGQSGGGWAKVHLPQLERGDDNEVVLRQVDFHAWRQPNLSYLVEVRGAIPA